MPAYPAPTHLVTNDFLIELLPEVHIRQFAALSPPVSAFPPWQPLGDAPFEVGRIGKKSHATGFGQRSQRFQSRSEFHPVIGRLWLAARQFFFIFPELQDCTPTAGAGVSAAGSVGIDCHISFWRYQGVVPSNSEMLASSSVRIGPT